MRDNSLIGPWIRRFLLEHLVAERNLARNTQSSYRDTMVLLLPFMARTARRAVDRLTVEDLSPLLVRRFLQHLETERGCGGATRNLRLGAIHSLAKFIGCHSPEHLAWCTEVRAVPFKKTARPTMSYLDKPEIDALLAAPDRRTERGARDHERVFLNRLGQPLTRFGIYDLVQKTVRQASATMRSLKGKRISPHSVRHTTAVHLLRASVDINTIRAWLGHVSLDTTHVYAEVDLEMKARALDQCDVPQPGWAKPWRRDAGIIGFLRAL